MFPRANSVNFQDNARIRYEVRGGLNLMYFGLYQRRLYNYTNVYCSIVNGGRWWRKRHIFLVRSRFLLLFIFLIKRSGILICSSTSVVVITELLHE